MSVRRFKRQNARRHEPIRGRKPFCEHCGNPLGFGVGKDGRAIEWCGHCQYERPTVIKRPKRGRAA